MLERAVITYLRVLVQVNDEPWNFHCPWTSYRCIVVSSLLFFVSPSVNWMRPMELLKFELPCFA
jgi:hypothetical protein